MNSKKFHSTWKMEMNSLQTFQFASFSLFNFNFCFLLSRMFLALDCRLLCKHFDEKKRRMSSMRKR